MDGVVRDLEWVARRSVETVTTKDLAVIFNGYDEAVPGKGGDWLQGPMTRLGIPAGKQCRLVDLMIKRFNEALRDLTRRLDRDFGGTPGRFAVADTVGVTGGPAGTTRSIRARKGFAMSRSAFAGRSCRPCPWWSENQRFWAVSRILFPGGRPVP